MRFASSVIALLFFCAIQDVAVGQDWLGRTSVAVPLVALPPTADDLSPHEVTTNEFLIQQITPLHSATLRADVTVHVRSGDRTFPSGSQLIYAQDVNDRAAYYCTSYHPTLTLYQRFDGVTELEWMCFQDSNNDGVFDRFFLTLRNFGHSIMPTFTSVVSGHDTSAPYTINADNPVIYERSITHISRGSDHLFVMSVRAAGETGWKSIAAAGDSSGDSVAVSGSNLPANVQLLGARFRVISADGESAVVQADPASAGVFALGIR